MKAAYADESYYTEEYRQGMAAPISGPEFSFYARKATKEIRTRTFGNIKESGEIMEEVKMCCCELAEKLYMDDQAKEKNGLVLQNFSNDGESGTFQVQDQTAEGIEAGIGRIIRGWLSDTGLLFCGVRKRNESKL